MKTIAGFEVDNDLARQIDNTVDALGLSKADVLRQALKFGLPSLARRLDPAAEDDWFAREYGLTTEEADRAAKKIVADAVAEHRAGKTRPWKPGP